jgi:preprotein translocase subunit Sec63
VLGVQADADDKQVKKTYRRLALKCTLQMVPSPCCPLLVVLTQLLRVQSCFLCFRTWCELLDLYAPDATSCAQVPPLI